MGVNSCDNIEFLFDTAIIFWLRQILSSNVSSQYTLVYRVLLFIYEFAVWFSNKAFIVADYVLADNLYHAEEYFHDYACSVAPEYAQSAWKMIEAQKNKEMAVRNFISDGYDSHEPFGNINFLSQIFGGFIIAYESLFRVYKSLGTQIPIPSQFFSQSWIQTFEEVFHYFVICDHVHCPRYSKLKGKLTKKTFYAVYSVYTLENKIYAENRNIIPNIQAAKDIYELYEQKIKNGLITELDEKLIHDALEENHNAIIHFNRFNNIVFIIPPE